MVIGVDDNGKAFEPSPDPRLDRMREALRGVNEGNASNTLRPILSDMSLWGVDLCEIGMAHTVTAFFEEMISGDGAVRATLEKYVLKNRKEIV